jgi:hypothetical protein
MMPCVLSLLLVLFILSKLDEEEVDKCLATCSKIDVIAGAFSSKRGDIKGEHDDPRFADLSLFFVVGHSGIDISGEITEARTEDEPELLTGKICFGGLDLRGGVFFLCLRKSGSSSDRKQGRQLPSFIVRVVLSGDGDSSILYGTPLCSDRIMYLFRVGRGLGLSGSETASSFGLSGTTSEYFSASVSNSLWLLGGLAGVSEESGIFSSTSILVREEVWPSSVA